MAEARAPPPVERREQTCKRTLHTGPVENLVNNASRHLPGFADANRHRHIPGRGAIKNVFDQPAPLEQAFRLAATHARSEAAGENDNPYLIHPEAVALRCRT